MNLKDLKAAILGHAIADAMGVPVEFTSREARKADPVTDYRGYGAHDVPAGTWSDDTSMTLAALDSLDSGLAGVLYGLEGITQKSQDGLIRKEVIDDLREKFAFSLQDAYAVVTRL